MLEYQIRIITHVLNKYLPIEYGRYMLTLFIKRLELQLFRTRVNWIQRITFAAETNAADTYTT